MPEPENPTVETAGQTTERAATAPPEDRLFARTAEDDWADPTEPYIQPANTALELALEEVDAWVAALQRHRILVLRCLDTDVLFAAECAIPDREPFNGEACNRLRIRRPARPEDTFPTLEMLLDPRLGARASASGAAGEDRRSGPSLVIARAYSRGVRPLMDSLPVDAAHFNDVVAHLRHRNRYLLILTTPAYIELKEAQGRLKLYEHIADFVYPKLKHLGPVLDFAGLLRKQYRAGLWGKAEADIRLDEAFHRQVGADVDAQVIGELIKAFADIPANLTVDARTYCMEEGSRIRKSFRGQAWPANDDLLAQIVLFVAGYFHGCSADDFDYLVEKLAGEDTRRVAHLVRTVETASGTSAVKAHKEVRLVEIWRNRRHEILAELALHVELGAGGEPEVRRNLEDDALIRRGFRVNFPFAHAELWKRAITAGLLFDGRDGVAGKWIARVAERVGGDLDGFGQTFLFDHLMSETALGGHEGDLGERFRSLEGGRFVMVLLRASELLEEALQRGYQEPVKNALEQLVVTRAVDPALRLLRRLSGNAGFALPARMGLVKRILDQGGKEHWGEACGLLERWCADSREGWQAVTEIAKWLPEGRGRENAAMAAAAGVLIEVAARWFGAAAGPTHPLAQLIAAGVRNQGSAIEMIRTLMKWLFHPCFEAACDQRELLGFYAYWIMAAPFRSASGEDRQKLLQLQRASLEVLAREMASGLAASGDGRVAAAVAFQRECQAVILADWAGALAGVDNASDLFDCFLGALTQYAPPAVLPELRAVLTALDRTGAWAHQLASDQAWHSAVMREAAAAVERSQGSIRELLARWRAADQKGTRAARG